MPLHEIVFPIKWVSSRSIKCTNAVSYTSLVIVCASMMRNIQKIEIYSKILKSYHIYNFNSHFRLVFLFETKFFIYLAL